MTDASDSNPGTSFAAARPGDEAAHRLEQIEFKNEQIMKEYLSLLIDSDDYADNVRPGFLPNPESLEKLEIDRYYANSVGFEYNGVQHFRTKKRFSSERVTRRDLSLKGMQAKIGNLLPLRDLRGHEELIKYREDLKKQGEGRSPGDSSQDPERKYELSGRRRVMIPRKTEPGCPAGPQGRGPA